MHKFKTFIVYALLVFVGLPLVSLAATESVQPVQVAVQDAISQVHESYQYGKAILEQRMIQKDKIADLQKHLTEVSKLKRHYRLQMSRIQTKIQKIIARSSGSLVELKDTSANLQDQSQQLVDYLKLLNIRHVTEDDIGPRNTQFIFDHLFGQSLGESVDQDLRMTALARARESLLSSLTSSKQNLTNQVQDDQSQVQDLQRTVQVYRALYEDSVKEYDTTDHALLVAQNADPVGEEQKNQETAVMAEVNMQVQRIQPELDRIGQQTERRAERKLFSLQLFDPRPGMHVESDVTPAAPVREFIWPVFGPISAGFDEPSYRQKFGFPHHAIDIVTPMRTPVRATAPGVVFVAKDGGTYGFSYVLIGHANGYTSLYGHLNEIDVKAGDDIDQGQIIGLSGGMPGSHGAGPYTTGAHLHFQLTQNGIYIDPRGVLP